MIKVLIADDSVIYRSQIRAALANNVDIDVVGAASNGRLAIERLHQSPVDLLILDLEMPEMDGLQTLLELKRLNLKVKVLVFSSQSKRGAEITLEALRLGATDFIAKPSGTDAAGSQQQPSDRIRDVLLPKISGLFPQVRNSKSSVDAVIKKGNYTPVVWDLFNPQSVVIGSSTGGPTVLEVIFSQLSPPLKCPIFIAQHMPPLFTKTLAERLARISGLKVYEAQHGQKVEIGCVYVAPGDYHMTVTGTKYDAIVQLDQGPLVNSVRPAADLLFNSVADVYKEKTLGVVLTGMGADGKVGCEKIKSLNGAVVIQNAATCVVYGMPGAVEACGAFDKIYNPEEIINLFQEKIIGTKNSTNQVA